MDIDNLHGFGQYPSPQDNNPCSPSQTSYSSKTGRTSSCSPPQIPDDYSTSSNLSYSPEYSAQPENMSETYSDHAFAHRPTTFGRDVHSSYNKNEYIPLTDSELEQPRTYSMCGREWSKRQLRFIIAGVVLSFILLFGVLSATVFAPMYMRHVLSTSTISLHTMHISDPTVTSTFADATDIHSPTDRSSPIASEQFEFFLSAMVSLDSTSMVSGVVEPFQATLYFDGTAVTTIPMPRIEVNARSCSTKAIETTVHLHDIDIFTRFSEAMLLQDVVLVTLSANIDLSAYVFGVKVAGFHSVQFDKTLEVKGAGGLRDSEIVSFSLENSTAEHAMVTATLLLRNPAGLSIDPLGDLATDLFYIPSENENDNDHSSPEHRPSVHQKVPLGRVYAHDVSLMEGESLVLVQGVFRPPADASDSVSEMISRFLQGDPIPIHAILRPCGPPECMHAIPLYRPILQRGLELSAKLTAPSPPLVHSIELEDLQISHGQDRHEKVYLTMHAIIAVQNPLGANSPVFLEAVAMQCGLLFEDEVLGQIVVEKTEILSHGEATDIPGVLNFRVTLSSELLLHANGEAFGRFLEAFVWSKSVDLRMYGSNDAITVWIDSVLGSMQLDVPIDTVSTIAGMDGLKQVKVDSFHVDDLEDDWLLTTLSLSLYNPSPVTVFLGDQVTLDIWYTDTDSNNNNNRKPHNLGYVALHALTIAPGQNEVAGVGYLRPEPQGLEAMSSMLSLYLRGENTRFRVTGNSVTLHDTPDAMDVPEWLLRGVRAVNATSELPGLPKHLVPRMIVSPTVMDLGMDFVTPTAELTKLREALWFEAVESLSTHSLLEFPAFLEEKQSMKAQANVQEPPFRSNVSSYDPNFEEEEEEIYTEPRVTGTVGLVLQLPFSVPLQIEDTSIDLVLANDEGEPIGRFSTDSARTHWKPCLTETECDALAPDSNLHADTEDKDGSAGIEKGELEPTLAPIGTLLFSIPSTPIHIYNETLFSSLMYRMLAEPQLELRLKGTGVCHVRLPFGRIALRGLSLAAPVMLQGMDNFAKWPSRLLPGSILNTTAHAVLMSAMVEIHNPGRLHGALGHVALGMLYRNNASHPDYTPGYDLDYPLVMSEVPRLEVVPGAAQLSGAGIFTIPDATRHPVANFVALDLVSKHLQGIAVDVNVVGLPPTSPIGPSSKAPILQRAMEPLVTYAKFPGVNAPLLVNCSMEMKWDDFGKPYAPARLAMRNPVDATMKIVDSALNVFICAEQSNTEGNISCNAALDYGKLSAFFYDGDLSQKPILLPPKQIAVTDLYNVTMLVNILDDSSLIETMFRDGYLLAKSNGTIVAEVLSDAPGAVPLTMGVNITIFDTPMYAIIT